MGLDSTAIIHSVMESAAATGRNTGHTPGLLDMPTWTALRRLVTLAWFGLRAQFQSVSVPVIAHGGGEERR